MATAIRKSKTVTNVMIDGHNVGDAGAKALAVAIKENKTVTFVNFEGNRIRDDGAEALAVAIKENNNLTSVILERKVPSRWRTRSLRAGCTRG